MIPLLLLVPPPPVKFVLIFEKNGLPFSCWFTIHNYSSVCLLSSGPQSLPACSFLLKQQSVAKYSFAISNRRFARDLIPFGLSISTSISNSRSRSIDPVGDAKNAQHLGSIECRHFLRIDGPARISNALSCEHVLALWTT